MQLTLGDLQHLASFLEGFFFGLYSGIFALHLQIHASRKQNIVFHALWVLYVLTAATIALDTAPFLVNAFNDDISITHQLYVAQIIVFGFCDFIAQSILIHRCWVVWGSNIRVVIVPSILAFAYLVLWIASSGALVIGQGSISITKWGSAVALTGLTASMTVNALVTGLIVFRIFKVFHEVKTATSDEKCLGVTGGRKLQSIIFIIIESGTALFAIQLTRLIVGLPPLLTTTDEYETYQFIVSIHEMLNGITPTIILVRVSMGLSFHNEPSLVETVSSLQFADDDPNPVVEMESLSEGSDASGNLGNLGIEPDDLNANLEMVNISQERRDNGDGTSWK